LVVLLLRPTHTTLREQFQEALQNNPVIICRGNGEGIIASAMLGRTAPTFSRFFTELFRLNDITAQVAKRVPLDTPLFFVGITPDPELLVSLAHRCWIISTFPLHNGLPRNAIQLPPQRTAASTVQPFVPFDSTTNYLTALSEVYQKAIPYHQRSFALKQDAKTINWALAFDRNDNQFREQLCGTLQQGVRPVANYHFRKRAKIAQKRFFQQLDTLNQHVVAQTHNVLLIAPPDVAGDASRLAQTAANRQKRLVLLPFESQHATIVVLRKPWDWEINLRFVGQWLLSQGYLAGMDFGSPKQTLLQCPPKTLPQVLVALHQSVADLSRDLELETFNTRAYPFYFYIATPSQAISSGLPIEN
jgi:hypothetical protein